MIAPTAPPTIPSLNGFQVVQASTTLSTGLQAESTSLEVAADDSYDEYIESVETEQINDINDELAEHSDGAEGGISRQVTDALLRLRVSFGAKREEPVPPPASLIASYGSYMASACKAQIEKVESTILTDQSISTATSELIESTSSALQATLNMLNSEIESTESVLADMDSPLESMDAEA